MKNNENQPIVDALLEEWLGNQKPSSLTVDDLGMRRVDPQRALELDQALQAATNDLRTRKLASSAAMYRKRKSYSSTFRVMATLAACLVIGVGGWAIVNRDRLDLKRLGNWGNQPVVANNNAASPTKLENGNGSSVAASDKNRPETAQSDKAVKSKGNREKMPLESLPFNTQATIANKSTPSGKPVDPAVKLDEQAIVKLIDQGMLQLWNNHDAKPAAPISGVAWIERTTQQLLARSATQEELDVFAKKDSLALRLDSLHRIVETSEFSQVWARRLAAFYLDVDTVSPRESTPERRAFVQWIRKELNQSRRLDSVVKNIVLTQGIEGSEPSPSVHWWSDLGSRNITAPAEVIASKLLGNRASCSRCHDANVVASADQARFWSLAAIVDGVEVSVANADQKAKIKYREEATPLFYERSDATMVAALPELPNGRKLKTPIGSPKQQASIAKQNLATLSDWVLQSDELAQTHVDFVWSTLFGQPLVGNYPLDESEGRQERVELAKAIGQQLRANEYDLRKLVTWIAASQVFGLESLAPESSNGNWYLAASDKDLALFRQRQMLFAAYPAIAKQDSSFRSIEKLAAWFDASKVLGNVRGKVLANPLPPTAPSAKSSKPIGGVAPSNNIANEMTSSQVQYLVRAQLLPKTIQAEVDKMVQSNLAWNVLVDHAFYMTGSTSPSQSDRVAAQHILDMSRDKRLALSRIIAARL